MKLERGTKLGIAAAVALVLAAGNFHVVNGAMVDGITLMPKVSWSMSETFVNSDVVANMPGIMARAQYPLFLAAIEKRNTENDVSRLTAENRRRIHVGQERRVVEALIGAPENQIKHSDGDVTAVYINTMTAEMATVTYRGDYVSEVHR